MSAVAGIYFRDERPLDHADLTRMLEAFVLKPPKIIDAYLDTVALRRVYERYSQQQREEDALTVWKAVTLGRWLQQTELTA